MSGIAWAVIAVLTLLAAGCSSAGADPDDAWQRDFDLAWCELASTGRNEFFVLEPGFRLTLEGGNERLAVTVLDETKVVDGVVTRVVEEREWNGDTLVEVSRNYFAICPETKDVFYFGEGVDDYRRGEIVGHAGAWLAGVGGASAGLIMPGTPVVGMKYYQEIAPGVALDRAEVVGLDAALETPAGRFTECLVTKEGTALNTGENEFKVYAPGVGLIQDQGLRLTGFGFAGSS